MTAAMIIDDVSLDGLLAAIANEPAAADLDLSQAVRREGCESVVLDAGGWIIRFPRQRDDLQFEAEIAVLAHVHGRLPVETPDVRWIGQHTRCLAYPKITGTDFTPQQWKTATEAERQRLSASLAELLVAWSEAFSEPDPESLGVGPLRVGSLPDEPAGGPPYAARLAATLPEFPADVRPAIERLLGVFTQLYEQDLAERGPVLLHGDFHLGNMVLDSACGRVTGLWDFSCVSTGALPWDLHYLTGEVSDPAQDPNPPGTGQHLDLLGRIVDRLPGQFDDQNSILVLSNLMQCAEWIGDHSPDEAAHWQPWLDRLNDR